VPTVNQGKVGTDRWEKHPTTKTMDYINHAAKHLYEYYPPLTKEEDFDTFWARTIAQAKGVPLNPTRKPHAFPSPYIQVYDITYHGFDQTPIHGWYLVPTFTSNNKLPCLIHYHGARGNRGVPSDFAHWVLMGVAVLSMDCRGQGGPTGNLATYSWGNAQVMSTKGLLDKDEYYYRAVYMDCLKAIDFACAQEEVDSSRIILEGTSQGGGLVMAVSALDPRPFLAMAQVPSNSDLTRRVAGAHGVFGAVGDYLRNYPEQTDQVLRTLSYFDTMNMADAIKCKVLASVGLRDNICPPECYFATYNRIKSEKDICIYPFNGHDGAGALHREVQLRFLRKNLG
jgi:cephalosporin-C deacetylase